jgi:hypothetical protein
LPLIISLMKEANQADALSCVKNQKMRGRNSRASDRH